MLHIPNYVVLVNGHEHIVCVTKTEEGWLTYDVTSFIGGPEANQDLTAYMIHQTRYGDKSSSERNEMTMNIFNIR